MQILLKVRKVSELLRKNEEKKRGSYPKEENQSINEMPVDTLDPTLKPYVKVVKPSRAAQTYERYE